MIKVTVGTGLNREDVIVEGSKTPKEIMAENHIDFSRGGIQLDGCPLTSDKMNTPIEKLVNGADSCFLVSIVKADSGAKLQKLGNSITLSTSILAKDFTRLSKLSPEALELRDAEGKAYFKVAFGPKADISKFGITFDSTNEVGAMYLTKDAAPSPTDAAIIAEAYLGELTNLIDIEDQVVEALKTVDAAVKNATDSVEVIS